MQLQLGALGEAQAQCVAWAKLLAHPAVAQVQWAVRGGTPVGRRQSACRLLPPREASAPLLRLRLAPAGPLPVRPPINHLAVSPPRCLATLLPCCPAVSLPRCLAACCLAHCRRCPKWRACTWRRRACWTAVGSSGRRDRLATCPARLLDCCTPASHMPPGVAGWRLAFVSNCFQCRAAPTPTCWLLPTTAPSACRLPTANC